MTLNKDKYYVVTEEEIDGSYKGWINWGEPMAAYECEQVIGKDGLKNEQGVHHFWIIDEKRPVKYHFYEFDQKKDFKDLCYKRNNHFITKYEFDTILESHKL